MVCAPTVYHRHERCVEGIITCHTGSLDSCQVQLFEDSWVDQAIKVTHNLYMLSVRNNSEIAIHCLGEEEKRESLGKVRLFQIEPGCVVSTDS